MLSESDEKCTVVYFRQFLENSYWFLITLDARQTKKNYSCNNLLLEIFE